MTEWLKRLVLRWMRVPPEPLPPAGVEGSVRIFHASKRFYQLNLLRWGIGQIFAAIGIIFALGVLAAMDIGQEQLGQVVEGITSTSGSGGAALEELGKKVSEKGGGLLLLLHLFELFGIAAFLVQLPFSYTLVRLDYEMRWYIVTDHSLRIREGIWRVNELTLTFANVQEVAIRQGPLQRLLDISDLRVRTAGGGGRSSGSGKGQNEDASGHVGFFRGVDDAEAIRDLILERLRQLRDAGLGDPDQASVSPKSRAAAASENPLLAAAGELLAEARAFREHLS